MNKDDIQSLARISSSLWGDLGKSVAMSEDTLGHVSLLNLSDERAIERASKVMIERAEKNPPAVLKLNHPFFRLAPLERFLLTALHIEKWNYDRVARTLNIEISLIETLAWATRLKFAFQLLQLQIDYPRGPSKLGPVCPDFNPSHPWTQRLLDDQLGKRERQFLQNHLMGCDRCRHTLESTKRLFFKIEELIPVQTYSAEIGAASEHILATWNRGEKTVRPMLWTTRDSVWNFILQPKTQFAIGVLWITWMLSAKK